MPKHVARAYHHAMPRSLRWTLLFTEACLEHLEERGIGAEDVANAVFGIHGRVRVRRIGRDDRERWFVVGQIDLVPAGLRVDVFFEAGAQIINDRDSVARFDQGINCMATNKASASGDENVHDGWILRLKSE